MRTAQKGIKLGAIVFAIILIIIIVYLLFQALAFFKDMNNNKTYNNEVITKKIKSIDIDLKMTSLNIDTCSELRVDTDNEFVKIEIVDNKLRIKEKKHSPITRKDTDSINLCIKDNKDLESIDLDMGAGKLEVEELTTKKARFDLGAGKVTLNKLNITDEFELDGGAGSINIDNSSLNNSDIELGVGVLNFNGVLLGNTEIEGGIGSLNINVYADKDDYKFIIEKGVGKITIDDTSYSTTIFGEGKNLIKLETGIGSATINFKNNG